MGRECNLLEIEETKVSQSESREDQICRIIEGLLFASKEPVSVEKLRQIINSIYPIRTAKLLELIACMQKEYRKQKRAFQIDEIAGGYVLRTTQEMAPFLEQLHPNRRGENLSEAAVEVLAIVAYKGPITRPEIDQYRGVDSSGTLASLVERGLVEGVGRKNAPGRPMQYATTTLFLTYYGLKGREDLRPL